MRHLFLLFLIWSQLVLGQSILVESIHPANSPMCEEIQFKYHIESFSISILSNVLLTVKLPDDVEYVIGSNDMMMEVDVSDLNSPQFVVNDLMPLSISEISFRLKVGCEIYSAVQEGREYQNQLDFTHPEFEYQYSSDPYTFNPALLVITDLNDQNEITNTSFSRYITIQNGRLGRTDQFIFSDFHDEVQMTSNSGTIIEESETTLKILLDSNAFKSIGNQDGYFDLDEEIIIEELINHGDCSPEIIKSEIQVSWGCDSLMCQIDTGFADINLSPLTGQAKLRTSGYGEFPYCPCLPDGYRQCIYLKNFGNAATKDLNVIIDITNKDSEVLGGLENTIRIDSGNATIRGITYDTLKSLSCPGAGNVFGFATVSISELAPGQEIVLCFDLLPCFELYPANGKDVQFRWTYGYEHETKCKPFSQQKRFGVEVDLIEGGANFEHLLEGIDKDEDWVPGEIYQLKWQITGSSLLDSGRLELYTCLPCGISALDSIKLFSSEILLDQTKVVMDSMVRISSTYRLPFKSDSAIASLNVSLDCSAPCIKALGVPQDILYMTTCEDPLEIHSDYSGLICSGMVLSKCPDSLDCGFVAEGFVSVGLDCDEYNRLDTVYAYVKTAASISRVSFGLEDDNDDRLTSGSVVDTSAVQHLKGVISDTFLADFKGEIVVESPLNFLDSLDFALVSKLPFDFIRAQVAFKDSETSEYWICDIDSARFLKKDGLGPGCCQTVVQQNGEIAIHIELNPEILQKYCDVPDFVMTSGDSVFCKIWVRNPIHVPVQVSNTIVQYIGGYNRGQKPIKEFSCGPIGTRLSYSGMVLNIYPYDDIAVDVCGENTLSGGWKIDCLEPMDNFFQYEFRNLLKFEMVNFEVPDEFAVDSMKITVNYRKDFLDLDTTVLVLRTEYLDGRYEADSVDLLKIKFDEGAYYYFQPYLRLKDCSEGPLETAPRIHMNAEIRGVDDFKFAIAPLINTSLESISPHLGREILIDYPIVSLQAGGAVIDASDRKVCKTIQMELSESVNILQWSAGFIYDSAAQFELTEKNGLMLQEVEVGEYVGLNVERGVYEFQFCFISKSCLEDSLVINMNWACEMDIDGEICYDTSFVYEIRKYDAELELDLEAIVKNIELCDTTEWWYIDVFNGDIGSAYDVSLSFTLPAGLDLFENGMQYKYPANAGWLQMPFPDQIGPLEYNWNITQILDTEYDQLPGVNELPDNRMQVRIKLITSCELEQRSLVNFFVSGENPCGSRTNLVRKSTSPIEIKDVANSFQSNLQVDLNHSDCDEKILVHIKASSNLNTSGGELIEVSLPEELNYFDGSMSNLQNISVQVPGYRQEFGRTVLTFISESMVPANEIIAFSFEVGSWRTLECAEDNVSVVLKTKRTAYCKNLGRPCETSIINGRSEISLLRDVVLIQIDSAQQLDTAGSKLLKIWIKGESDSLNAGFLIRLHQDVNMNHILDDNDKLFRSDSFDLIDTVDSKPYCIAFEDEEWCSWIIEVGGPCFCNSDTLYFETGYIKTTDICDTICNGDTIVIGINGVLPGAFSWHSKEAVCDTCSVQQIKGENAGDTISTREYTLELKTPEGCREVYFYSVKTYPFIGPFFDTIEICPKDSALLAVNKFADWLGPKIDKRGATEIKVAPDVKSTYRAVYLDDNGCYAEHNFLVLVSSVTSYTLDSTFFIRKGDSIQLFIEPLPDSLIWSPSDGLSCIDCPEPWAKPDSTMTYEAMIYDSSGCPQVLTFTIEVAPPPCDEGSIYLPNVFSPNGDNINDFWRFRSHVVDMVEIVVYNRWGEQVFTTTNPDFQWDGTYRGEYLKPDVFAYYAQFKCLNGESLVLKGNLSLIR